jgi:hypothetical protein
MSNLTKKTVKIKESHLVDLIDNIVNEAVAVKKQEWLTEQAQKSKKANSLFENRIAALEKKLLQLTEGRK